MTTPSEQLLRTRNKFFVGAQGESIVIMRQSSGVPISKADALNLAAWLVVLAEEDLDEFQALLDDVRES